MRNFKISLIAALGGKSRVIGNSQGKNAKEQIPWNLPQDMKYFREKTKGNIVIMGKTTFESMDSKPLKNRINIVLTRNTELSASNDLHSCNSLPECLLLCSKLVEKGAEPEVFVIGGAKIYSLFLNLADKLYLTLIQGEFQGDVYFPDYNNIFTQVATSEKQWDENLSYRFVQFAKKTDVNF